MENRRRISSFSARRGKVRVELHDEETFTVTAERLRLLQDVYQIHLSVQTNRRPHGQQRHTCRNVRNGDDSVSSIKRLKSPRDEI